MNTNRRFRSLDCTCHGERKRGNCYSPPSPVGMPCLPSPYLEGVVHATLRGQSVPPCATAFLIIVGQGLGEGEVEDVADVGLVDTERERERREGGEEGG